MKGSWGIGAVCFLLGVSVCGGTWAGPHGGDPAALAGEAGGDVSGSGMAAGHAAAPDGTLETLVVPDNVVRVDGVGYSGNLLKRYVADVLEQRVTTAGDLLKYADDMALDISGYDIALREQPALENDVRVRQAVEKIKARLLPEIFFREEVRKKVNPTVEELLPKLPDPPPMYEVSVIVNPEESRIDEAAKALAGGTPFEEAARKYSEGVTAEKGGKLGALVDGKFDLFTEQEFRVIKALQDGEVSRPFMTRIGWAIVKMEKRWSPEMLKRQDIERNYGKYKSDAEKARMEALYGEILARYKVAWNDNNLLRIKEALSGKAPFTEELRLSEIFRVDDVPVYAMEIDSLSRFHSPEALDVFIDKRVRSELLAREAARLGYASEAAPVVDLAKRRAVTREFFKRKAKSFAATDQDIEEYYSKNREKFLTEDLRGLLVIETTSRKKAEEAAKKARRKGADFRELAAKYNYREESRKARGEVGFLAKKNLQPSLGEAIFRADEGAVLGPYEFKDAGGKAVFAVVKVESIRKPTQVPLEKLNHDALADKIVAGRMETFHNDFIRKVSESHKVEILTENGGGVK